MPKFDDITVQLVGRDGNAFGIMAAVRKAMQRKGCSQLDIDAYLREAQSGDYNNLLAVTMNWVNVE